ncbi:cystatin-2 [Rhipicephalus microplus]|uniref:cystatin-2 n=1 Tax=Rhipicephalus microplus TaxID=6941 RepID=UPI003F6B5E95
MKGAVVLLVVSVTVAECSSKRPGEWMDQDPLSDPKYMKLAHYALIEQEPKEKYYYTVLNLLEVKTQVVNGVNYALTFEITPSDCPVADGPYDGESCMPTGDEPSAVCTAVVYERSWKKQRELVTLQCHS